MRSFFLVYIFCCSVIAGFAQTDSIAFSEGQWQAQRVGKGVLWKHCLFRDGLFASDQNISILEVRNRGKRKFDLAVEEKVLKRTSDFGKQARARAAINGTFFDIRNGGSVDYIRADGKVIHENRLRKDGSRADHQKAALVIRRGKVRISKWDGTEDWEKRLEGEDVMVTGPLLVYGGFCASIDSTSFSKTRHPRTAIAVTKKRVLLITVDGRSENAEGMSLYELASILKWLGATDAVNLDGGGSTTMWISGQPDGGVVNFPSDNKAWDHEGERKVANVILLRCKSQ